MTLQFINRIWLVLSLDEGSGPKVGKYFKCYDDANGQEVKAPIGFLTVGVGHNIQDRGLSPKVVRVMFEEDIEEAVAGARSIAGDTFFDSLEEPRQIAITCLVFNMGLFKFSKFVPTIALLKNRRWDEASSRLEKTLWAQQVKSKRVGRITKMLRSCEYDAAYGITA